MKVYNLVMAQIDTALLQAALIGFETEKKRIQQAIGDLQNRLGKRGRPGQPGSFNKTPQKKHRISAEGRKRIAEAQKRRWAAAKKAAQ